jgi:sulfatase maturation enzyme AslB (radical SAM superfamily)
LKAFCAAPWLEAVLYNNGEFKICSRNSRSFGRWDEKPLSVLWQSDRLKKFRQDILLGEYPDEDCEACHRAGTSQSFSRILTNPWEESIRLLWRQGHLSPDQSQELQDGIKFMAMDLDWHQMSSQFQSLKQLLEALSIALENEGQEVRAAVALLKKSILVIEDFNLARLTPRVVGPFRQVQLISKCNARCAMCPGLFTGELANGSSISKEQIPAALDSPNDVLDFFCNGSEFLLFNGWRDIASRLREQGCQRLRISTNGMLLTEENLRFLLSQDVVGHLNISLNSGTRETLERVQERVCFQKVEENVARLFSLANEMGKKFPVSFSFVLMRSTLAELPDFFRLIEHWSKNSRVLKPHAMILSMENAGLSNYRSFLFAEHPQWIERDQRMSALREAAQLSRELGIHHVLYNFGNFQSLEEVVKSGDVPEFVSRPEDIEAIDAKVRSLLDPWYQEILDQRKESINAIYDGTIKFPFGEIVHAADDLSEKAETELRKKFRMGFVPPPLWKECFAAFPEYLDRFLSYGDEYLQNCLIRLPERLSAFHRDVFASKMGYSREEAPEHCGEKFWPAQWEHVGLGTRVLYDAKRIGQFLLATDGVIYVSSLGRVKPIEKVRVRGVFALDSSLSNLETLELDRKKALLFSEIESLYQRGISLPDSKLVADGFEEKLQSLVFSSEEYIGRFGHGSPIWSNFYTVRIPDDEDGANLACGQIVLNSDYEFQIFLLAYGDFVYVADPKSEEISLIRRRSLRGAFHLKDAIDDRRIVGFQMKAFVHSRIHHWKSKCFGDQPSPFLWSLSQRYRQAMGWFGIEIPSHLVIPSQK